MKNLMIQGNNYLRGEVRISGAKNSALPIIAASIISKGLVTLYNVPKISDVYNMLSLLSDLNITYEFSNTKLLIDSSQIKLNTITDEKLKKIRASYYLMGALLAVFKQTMIVSPGGCKIGQRPIDFHLMAFAQMGGAVEENNIVIKDYQKATISFKKKSVGASINALLASMGSSYSTTINNISLEPEVMDVINFLKCLGANIKVLKNRAIVMAKKSINNDIAYRIIPDRVETATYLFLGLLCGSIRVNNVEPTHLSEVLDIIARNGGKLIVGSDYIIASKSRLEAFNLIIGEYPMFPTDIQPLLCPLLALSKGSGYVIDKIFENRFMACNMLNKMGASINIDGALAAYEGVEELYGAEVEANDLRCAASLLIAALAAKGKTCIKNISYIERGYSNIYFNVRKLGGKIELIKD